MKPNDYHSLIVAPTVAEFLSDTKDLRRGMLAAMVLFHMADCVAAAGRDAAEASKALKQLHLELAAQCPDFSLLRDVANAAKHVTLHARNGRQVHHVNQVSRRPGFFDAPMGFGYFAEAICVEVKLDDGTTRTLEEVVRSVSRMWEARLEIAGKG